MNYLCHLQFTKIQKATEIDINIIIYNALFII